MDSFVFALDTTMPVFLVILLGWFLRRVGVLNEAFCKPADQYVFKCALPVSLFLSIAKMDVYSDFDPLFCLFCFTVTAIVFLGVWALTSRLMKDKALVGEFSQAAVRSSAAILGVALNTNIYGNAGMVPMMVLSAVPFFNVYAVLILQFSPHTDENGRLIPPERNGAAAVRRAGQRGEKPDHPRHSAGRAVFAAAREAAGHPCLDAQHHRRNGDAGCAAGGRRVFLRQ